MKTRWELALTFVLVGLLSSGCFRSADSLAEGGNSQQEKPTSDGNSGGDLSNLQNPLQPTCEDVTVMKQQILVHGTGCDIGDVGLNAGAQTITLNFANMQVQDFRRSTPADRNRFCTIQIPVNVPEGLSVGMDTLEFKGLVDFSGTSDAGSSATLETKFQWDGGAEQGPYKDIWYQQDLYAPNPNPAGQPNPYLRREFTSRNQAQSPQFSTVGKAAQTKLLNITINMSTSATDGGQTYLLLQSGNSTSVTYRCISSNPSNKAPRVEGGPNQTIQFPYYDPNATVDKLLSRCVSPIYLLEGANADDDGLPLYPGKLSCKWKQINRAPQDCLVTWENPLGDELFKRVAVPAPTTLLMTPYYLEGHGLEPEFWVVDDSALLGHVPCAGKVEVQMTCTDGEYQNNDWKVLQISRQ